METIKKKCLGRLLGSQVLMNGWGSPALRSWPFRRSPEPFGLAATLVGSLRPGSLRVHHPCKEMGHGSRLGFPGRCQTRGPATSGNVAHGPRVSSRTQFIHIKTPKPREGQIREESGIWFAGPRSRDGFPDR